MPPRRAESPGFEEAARRIAERSGGIAEEPLLRPPLLQFVERRFGRSLDGAERHDVVEDALVAFDEAAEKGDVKPATAAAYLLTVARHKAVDALRLKRRREAELSADAPEASHDAGVERLLDRDADHSLIRDALEELEEIGASNDVRVIMVWLDLAARPGGPPDTREVGELAGVSHTQVQRVLRRLRDRIGPRR